MSISSISGGVGSIYHQAMEAMRSNGGLTKDGLSEIQNQLKSSSSSSDSTNIDDLIDSFDEIDVDGNGKLDDSEMRTYSNKMGVRPPPPPPMGGEGSEDEQDDIFADGLTEDELTEVTSKNEETGTTDKLMSALLSSFDEADTDGNGAITQDEFQAFADANGFKPPVGGMPPPPPESQSSSDDSSSSTDSSEESSNTSGISSLALQKLLSKYTSGAFSTDELSSLFSAIEA